MSSRTLFVIFFVIFFTNSVALTEDFYQLLGIGRDADDRSVRRAFKKLAMKYHPDKNKNDPEAHSKFVKINRAYEVLKDEELRKKYDLYGEDGLKDDFQGGFQHQSWQFFNENFGIYDEDPEIITLNRGDFEESVASAEGSIWFVNFYSPQCSHCHQLAPTWRLLARELEFVIRIGAVNCGDDFILCQEQGVFSYPSLILYPQRERYSGEREKDDLVNFVIERISSTILRLNIRNLKPLSEEWAPYTDFPWLVDFCDESESCLSTLNRRKLSIILDGLVNVGTVSCTGNQEEVSLCEHLGRRSGVAYFPEKGLKKEKAKVLESFDAKELAFTVLSLLPDIQELTEQSFLDLIEKIKRDGNAWLIQFVGQFVDGDLEMKKLPSLLGEIKCARLNCSKYPQACSFVHIKKYPTVAVFKPTGGYEIHHGRYSAHDVAAFALDSATTNVRCMNSHDLSSALQNGGITFVDFFAPWCPPCMKLLPEFRKAAKVLGHEIQFGTVDCTVHRELCVQLNVHSYPTTILYNNSHPHSFVGFHSYTELVTFVEDIKNPPVVSLTSQSFSLEVIHRRKGVYWLVDFFAPWCEPCQELAPEWRELAKMLKERAEVYVGQVDCVQESNLCREQQVHSYPMIRLYPGSTPGYVEYNNWFRNAESIRQWLYGYLPSKVLELTSDGFFQEVLDGSEPWLVDFFAPWCGHCHMFAPEFEKVAEMLDGKVKLGKVNCDVHHSACHSASVAAYPTVRYYGGTSAQGFSQSADGIDIQSQDSMDIVQFVKQLMQVDYPDSRLPKDEL